MANQKLNIDIVAKDRTRQALSGVRGALGKLRSSIFSVQSAFVGLGAGLVIRNLVNTGKNLENLRTRLKFLLKDTNEGAKAFDNMVKFASRVPFSLEEIQSGSGILATVTDNAKDLQKMLEITGNVAAVTGLDFRTASEQIQRSFSAGIGAADLFREKGVRNMLGFKAGATVSIEDTVQAFEKVFGRGGRFGKATDELANTFEGTLSMIGDKIFNFKKTILEAGLFESLKKEFGSLDKFLEENSKQIDNIAKDIGIALGFAVKKIADFVIILKDNMDKFAFAIKGLIAVKVVSLFLSLGKAIKISAKQMSKFSLATMLSVKGLKGLVALVAKGGALFVAFKGIDKLFEETAESFEEFSHKVTNSLPDARDLRKVMHDMKKDVEFLPVPLREFEHELSVAIPTAFQKARGDAFKGFKEGMKSTFDVTTFERFKTAGEKSLRGLQDSLTDFIITGKLSFQTLKDVIIRSIVEALVGSAVQSAIKKGTALFKMSAIREGLISVYKGALKTFASLPFPINIVAAGAAVGAGMKLVDKIKGFEKGGAVAKGQPVLVGERGAEMFVPNQTGQITQSARGTGGGAVNVNFNINTVDASGFEDLLFRSRGAISSLINQAVNEQGRGAVV